MSEKYYCFGCDKETSDINDIDTDGFCSRCRRVECEECGRKFDSSDLVGGLCRRCDEKLTNQANSELAEREREYWSDRF